MTALFIVTAIIVTATIAVAALTIAAVYSIGADASTDSERNADIAELHRVLYGSEK